MAGEITIRARLDPEASIGDIIRRATSMSSEDLTEYYYVVQFDPTRIRLPSSERGLSDSDPQDIHRVIENRWSGEADTIDELDTVMMPFLVYAYIPIVITMYPRAEVEKAVKGQKVHFATKVIDERTPEEQAALDAALYNIQAQHEAFRSLPSGRRKLPADLPGGDVRIRFGDVTITFAPDGRIRTASGRLGPYPVSKSGKYSLIKDMPIRQRRDGSVWMRIRTGRGKRTGWIKIKEE